MNRFRLHEAKPKRWLNSSVWIGRVFTKQIEHPAVAAFPKFLAIYFIEDELYFYNDDFYRSDDPDYKHINVELLEKYYNKEALVL